MYYSEILYSMMIIVIIITYLAMQTVIYLYIQ